MTSPLPTRLLDAPLAVSTHEVSKRYGRIQALRDVTLQVPEHAVYLLVGHNGAGKSTMLKILLDLIALDSGRASVFDFDAQRQGAEARATIGYVPELSGWGYGWMRVSELLRHHGRYFPTWDAAYADRLSRDFQLRLDQRVSQLSKGQARRVHLVMAMAHRPPLLLLDEPTDGLDPIMRDETLGILSGHLAETPTTVLLSTHHVEEVESLADHIGVLRDGTLRAQMSFDQLRRGLRRYRAEVPDGWGGVPNLNGAVLRRVDAQREVQWIIWGDEPEIVTRFSDSRATVRDVTPVSLLDATLALLTAHE